ncbi:hypothetical protein [Luteimonas sp. gir]|uniref:hypothetical protein n=1 Tax=Luteimonas sp. gir TaxID=3127960 RepID=UPI003075CDFA
MHKIPTWLIICLTALTLTGGLASISTLEPDQIKHASIEIGGAPLWLFLVVGVSVYVLEAFVWTVAFTEFGARFFKHAAVGALLGVVAYGPIFHGPEGWFSILVSSWICFVLNMSYMIIRKRSRRTAILSTVAHKLVFILYAAWEIFLASEGQ